MMSYIKAPEFIGTKPIIDDLLHAFYMTILCVKASLIYLLEFLVLQTKYLL